MEFMKAINKLTTRCRRPEDPPENSSRLSRVELIRAEQNRSAEDDVRTSSSETPNPLKESFLQSSSDDDVRTSASVPAGAPPLKVPYIRPALTTVIGASPDTVIEGSAETIEVDVDRPPENVEAQSPEKVVLTGDKIISMTEGTPIVTDAFDSIDIGATTTSTNIGATTASTSMFTDASTSYYRAFSDDDIISKTPGGFGAALSKAKHFLFCSFCRLCSSVKETSREAHQVIEHAVSTFETDAEMFMKDGIYINGNEEKKSCLRKVFGFFCSSAFLCFAMFFSMAAGLAYGAINRYDLFNKIDWDQQLYIAFAGSSYLFVNDVPRLMEAISEGQVIQDSCLHAGGSLAALLMTGNGMYHRWQTSDALLQVPYSDGSSGYTMVYDYGACSVHQLITGYDQYIQYGNNNKAYYDDGTNPCLVDEAYMYYAEAKYEADPPKWDYIVLADQSKRMASSNARYDTVDALVSVYGQLLEESGAVPVIVDTHAFWSSQSNMTGLYDIPTFTQMIYEGVQEYVEALAAELPEAQAPIVVPIGLAFLTIWEEDYDIWTTLFLSDEMHASLYGSYLFACVLYTKLFGHLPRKESVPEHMEYLFVYSRKIIGQSLTYPTTNEASYLRNVAKRVVLDGHIPSSFTRASKSDGSFAEDDEVQDDDMARL